MLKEVLFMGVREEVLFMGVREAMKLEPRQDTVIISMGVRRNSWTGFS